MIARRGTQRPAERISATVRLTRISATTTLTRNTLHTRHCTYIDARSAACEARAAAFAAQVTCFERKDQLYSPGSAKMGSSFASANGRELSPPRSRALSPPILARQPAEKRPVERLHPRASIQERRGASNCHRIHKARLHQPHFYYSDRAHSTHVSACSSGPPAGWKARRRCLRGVERLCHSRRRRPRPPCSARWSSTCSPTWMPWSRDPCSAAGIRSRSICEDATRPSH